MNWHDQKTRMRRFLRDPDANIWSEDLLMDLYNDVQREIQQKTLFLEDVKALRVPPLYHIAYLHDWEWRNASPTRGKNYQALRYNQASGNVFCHRWEVEADFGIDSDTADWGAHFTQPWEAWMVPENIGQPVPFWFPNNFNRARLVTWDEKPAEYLDTKKMMSGDSSWPTHTGKTNYYWRNDEIDEIFHLYPLPSSPVWDDLETPASMDSSYAGTFSWEIDGDYISGTGLPLTQEDTNWYFIFDWEDSMHEDLTDAVIMKGCFPFERLRAKDFLSGGIFQKLEDDTLNGGSAGVVLRRTETLLSDKDFGIISDIVEAEDNVLVVYCAEPTDIQDSADEGDFPRYLRKYIEYGTLERAYAVNNDGQIESLRDYWAYRKELGIKIIKKFMAKRRQDRDYRLVTKGVPGFRTKRQPRLPDTYPAIW